MHRIGLFVYGALSDAASSATLLYAIRLLSFWATPTMTAAQHLLFALTTSAYILIAIRLEERVLGEVHGEKYAAYRRTVVA